MVSSFSPTLSVVVVSWNTKDILRTCLQFLQGEETNELIVVDNASSDGSAEMVAREFTGATLIVNAKNYGFARAANIGIKSSSSDLVLLLNSDVFIDQKAIKKMKHFMQENKNVMIAGPSLVSADHERLVTFRPIPSVSYMLLHHLFIFNIAPFVKRCLPKYIQGAALLFRKGIFKMVGYFDERFFFYAEDADFSLRAMKKGLKIKKILDAEGIHLGGESSRKKEEKKYFLKRINAELLFLKKHYPRSTLSYLQRIMRCHFSIKSIVLRCLSYGDGRRGELARRAGIYREIASRWNA